MSKLGTKIEWTRSNIYLHVFNLLQLGIEEFYIFKSIPIVNIYVSKYYSLESLTRLRIKINLLLSFVGYFGLLCQSTSLNFYFKIWPS